jgi:uncharacterized oligopeptide transporter (OPT) family protein
MLVGLNVALSFFAGSVIAWGIIGPTLVHYEVAFGKIRQPEEYGVMNFASFNPPFSSKDTPSPRYWLLWPGVLAMIVISFTELLLQWKIIAFAFKAAGKGIGKGLYDISYKAGKEIKFLRKAKESEVKDLVEDPARPEEIPKMWMWAPGLIATIICMCVVMGVQYDMPVGMSVLSIFLAFFFSFLAIQCTGVTDITPLTAASKASQIILGGATKGEGWGTEHAQRLNLLGGALANMGANQSTDLTMDFRVGFLLRTPPIQQWYAQGIGTLVAVFVAPAMFRLFMKAYPCIINMDDVCPFSYPSVAAWRATAIAVTDPTFPIPPSSGIFSIVFSIFGAGMSIVKHFFWVGEREWYRKYHPNMMCIALAFVLPQTYCKSLTSSDPETINYSLLMRLLDGTAMVMGALWSHFWNKKNKKTYEIYAYAIAAGLIAGEGIGGVINAIFQVASISGDTYGSTVACPIAC